MTLDLQQAADYLKIHPVTLQERAKRGLIPGAAKPGKRWVFIPAGLDAYILSLSPCRSTGLGGSGTSIFPRKGEGLDAVLGLPIKDRHRRTLKD